MRASCIVAIVLCLLPDLAAASAHGNGSAASGNMTTTAPTQGGDMNGSAVNGTAGSGNGTSPAPAPTTMAAKASADGAVQTTWRTVACLAVLAPALVL
jgi:hypothetical protein